MKPCLIPPCHLIPVACLLGVITTMSAHAAPALLPAVEAEEQIYTYTPANNGAGPLWCYGSTCLVRIGERLFASGLETLTDQKPLNNCRWTLHERTEQGWKLVQADPKDRQREPCPIAGAQDGRLFLSTNPTLTEPGNYSGPAEPRVLEFSTQDPAAPPATEVPAWPAHEPFTEHSYRGFSGDGRSGEMLLLNIWMYDLYYWSFRDRAGKWSQSGRLPFPPGTEYEEPHPVRLCYPEIYMRNREVHFLGISDIVEPVKAWREYKLILNEGKPWDYDFRRLFYTWTPDITTTPFANWLEVASREKTCGHISNLDLWLDKDNRAHLLWLEHSVWDARVRDKFFPGEPITWSLHYGIVEKGKLVVSSQLLVGGEGQSSEIPGFGRLQATPDGRLFVLYYVSGADRKGAAVAENRVMELLPDGGHGKSVRVPLQYPFTSFMTATERGGSPPANDIELLGQVSGREGICYARVSLLNPVLADFTWSTQSAPEGTVLRLDGSPSRASEGRPRVWSWDIGGEPATGRKLEHVVKRGGPVPVTLTVTDRQGNTRALTRTLVLPPTPADLGLTSYGLVVRTEAEGFAAEGEGTIHVRDDKLSASGKSLSHWNGQGHWLEWEVGIPVEDDYFLLARYATPEDAARALTVDGQAQPAFRFAPSGGYGTNTVDNWARATLRGEDGKPVAIRLTAGKHKVRLQNPDGTGLNLDHLEWVARRAPAASQ